MELILFIIIYSFHNSQLIQYSAKLIEGWWCFIFNNVANIKLSDCLNVHILKIIEMMICNIRDGIIHFSIEIPIHYTCCLNHHIKHSEH